MQLTPHQQSMLAGDHGWAVQKSMQILVGLGNIYGAERLIPVTSVQVAGVSYENLGDAGLEFLKDLADGGGHARVLTTLNPAGMDIEDWQSLGIPTEFAEKQTLVLDAFARMGIVTTCTCTPYLSGNLPVFGEHIAWSESSAVCFANSVIGARTNREGGPSALAAALTGFTPEYGFHLQSNRVAGINMNIDTTLTGTVQFGALGKVVGEILEQMPGKPVPMLTGIPTATLEELKSFCASIATYGGAAMFHMPGITPEAQQMPILHEKVTISESQLHTAIASLQEATPDEVDFASLGCPHLSLAEIAHLARLLAGKQVRKEFWITTSRATRRLADQAGYTHIILSAGAKFAVDTCCIVAPIRGRFNAMATDSAKACYYAYAKNNFKTRLLSFEQVVAEVTQ